jgi:hypothetical protein
MVVFAGAEGRPLTCVSRTGPKQGDPLVIR